MQSSDSRRSRSNLARLGFCLLPLLVSLGCGKPVGTTVTGNVTWNGQPLAYGAISFVPADGATKTAGAMITGGKYRAVDVPPGEKIVQVISGAPPREPGGSADRPTVPEFTIPPDAPGNGAHHTITTGQQTLDLSLSSAGK